MMRIQAKTLNEAQYLEGVKKQIEADKLILEELEVENDKANINIVKQRIAWMV